MKYFESVVKPPGWNKKIFLPFKKDTLKNSRIFGNSIAFKKYFNIRKLKKCKNERFYFIYDVKLFVKNRFFTKLFLVKCLLTN